MDGEGSHHRLHRERTQARIGYTNQREYKYKVFRQLMYFISCTKQHCGHAIESDDAGPPHLSGAAPLPSTKRCAAIFRTSFDQNMTSP
jgi:hypothetical protein